MTIKEKELILIKALGLEIGDIIIFTEFNNVKYIITEDTHRIKLTQNSSIYENSILHLITDDWVKVEKPKRFGDLHCKDTNCNFCPFGLWNCNIDDSYNKTLYEILDYRDKSHNMSEVYPKIYKTLKEELDKEYEE